MTASDDEYIQIKIKPPEEPNVTEGDLDKMKEKAHLLGLPRGLPNSTLVRIESLASRMDSQIDR